MITVGKRWIFKLLTPWSRVLLEKLAGLQLVKKFPAFYGTRRFITAFTSFRHPSPSWASPIQSTYPQPTSCRSILILSTHLRLGLPKFRWNKPSRKDQFWPITYINNQENALPCFLRILFTIFSLYLYIKVLLNTQKMEHIQSILTLFSGLATTNLKPP